MTPTKRWKKLLALGCSHGVYADPSAVASVLNFRDSFKPEITIHLGDAIDCTAFMSSTVRDGKIGRAHV